MRRTTAMKTRIVKYSVNLSKLPPLTGQQRAEMAALAALAALAATTDKVVVKSDIPKLTDVFWKSAVRNPFYKATLTVHQRRNTGQGHKQCQYCLRQRYQSMVRIKSRSLRIFGIHYKRIGRYLSAAGALQGVGQ